MAVKATVLVDLYRWKDNPSDPNSAVNEAGRGDVISVSQEELDRALAMNPPGLSKGESPDGSEFANEQVEIPEDLAGMSQPDLKKLAGQLGLDVSELKTKDALVGAVAAAPGYERPQV